MAARRSLPIEQYQVGVVCALPDEMSAAISTLDERHRPITGQHKLDSNNYVLGRIHEHNVAIACLPAGVYGTVSAARVANDMLRTFTGLRFGLMVGIGGGIPNLAKNLDIRLGDIVISQPDKTYGGVVQYDLRKNLGKGQYERKGVLRPPPTMLLSALASLRADQNLDNSAVPGILAGIAKTYPKLLKSGYGFPGRENDILCCSQCDGSGSSSDSSGPCNGCVEGKLERRTREDDDPLFWYGTIASGNELMKNAAERDRLSEECGALCVEMEAAGLMNDFPCLVIRGICDYADSRKNDLWQKYAALTAAAYTKEFLGYISPEQTKLERRIQDIVDSLDEHLAKQSGWAEEHLREVQRTNMKQEQQYLNDQHRQCHQAFKTSTYERFKDANPPRVDGTCQWVLSHPQYQHWHTKTGNDLLWISADPGCGKSVLAKSLVDNELQSTDRHTVCYFFFKDNEEQDHVSTALCALLHQLFSERPGLIRHAVPAWEKNGEKIVTEEAELWRVLIAASSADESHDVTFVLDALDECRPKDRQLLTQWLSSFHTQTSTVSSTSRQGRLKFLVTGRPHHDIEAEFQKTLDSFPTIRLRGEEENEQIHKEIDLVIRVRVDEIARELRLNAQVKHELETNLLKMEHRTYLWLFLVIEHVRENIDATLFNSLPSTVEEAYEKCLNRGPAMQKSKVKRILQIVVGARRPLTVQEMVIAFGFATLKQPKSVLEVQAVSGSLDEHIRAWCGLFVFINHGRIYLIHQTAKEFLVCGPHSTTSLSGWRHCLNSLETEQEMARICVQYLCLKDIWPSAQALVKKLNRHTRVDELLEKDNSVQSFLVYCAEHWSSHLRDADMASIDSTNSHTLQLYDTSGTVYSLWFAIFWHAIRPYESMPQMNAIHLAAMLGHWKAVEKILETNQVCNINERDEDGHTALMWAGQFGRKMTVQMLLDAGADVHAQGGEYSNALQTASVYGHESVVQILIDAGTDVNAQGGEYGNALQAALLHGHESVVQILIDAGADVNAQGGEYGNTLQAVSLHGHESVVQMLIDAGTDVNAQGGEYGNALQAASWGGYEETVAMLLKEGVDVNAHGGRYGNALQAASAGGYEKTVAMLLKEGADVNAQGGEYCTSLVAALCQESVDVVRALLQSGAKPVDSVGGILKRLLADENQALRQSFLYALSRCLIFLGLGEDARFCSQQHSAVCSICRSAITGACFVCKSCGIVDICGSCNRKNGEAGGLLSCQTHEFLEVSCQASDEEDDEGHVPLSEQVRGWLQNLNHRFETGTLVNDPAM